MPTTENQQYTNAELARKVIGAVDAIQDAHVTVIDGARKLNEIADQIADVPGPNKVPRTGADGKLDAGWLPNYFATCTTSGSVASKAITIDGFVLRPGVALDIVLSEVNSAENLTLIINDGAAIPILCHGISPEPGNLAKGQVYSLKYSGSSWQIMAGLARESIGQTVWFEDTLQRTGFAPLNGGVITNFAATWPQMAVYLATTHGQARCFASLADREAAHVATWHTLAYGATIGWEGFGGVAKFFYDQANDQLYLPDLRGMFRASSGDGVIAPDMGDVMGDRIRKLDGNFIEGRSGYGCLGYYGADGVFCRGTGNFGGALPNRGNDGVNTILIYVP